jgi:hypothetical protein
LERAAIFVDGAYLDKLTEREFGGARIDYGRLGVDMVQLAATRQVTRAVLIAGDSDFVPAVEVVKQHGVLAVLWHGPIRPGPANTVHQELWEACDDRFEITRDVVNRAVRQDPPRRQ